MHLMRQKSESKLFKVQGCGAAAAQGRQTAAAARLRRVGPQAGHHLPQGQSSGHWCRVGSSTLQASS
eukprot:scaffold4145_cov115-Isochrysis_galbana.AAC.18